MKGRILGLLCFVCMLGLFIGFATPTAYACSRGPTTLEEDFLEASAIFTAKVTSVDAVYPSQKAVVVEPDKVFKGQSPTFLLTNDDSDQCGAGIEIGETYLFYSQGWDLPYVSVFDLLSTQRAEKLTHWLSARTEKQQPKPPRTETILAHRQGEIRIFFEHHDRGYSKKTFITNNSIYVPLSFFNDTLWHSAGWNEDKNEIVIDPTNRLEFEDPDPDPDALLAPHRGVPKEISAAYNDINIKVKNETLQEHPEAFVSSEEIFVPLRAIAEKLGYEVEWIDSSSSVILHIPLEKQSGPKTLAMRYINNIGIQFYLKMDKQEIRLLVSHELLRKIESDASFREKVGAKLGAPMSEIPRNRILTFKDFE